MVQVEERRAVFAIAGCAEGVGWRCADCPGEWRIADACRCSTGCFFVDLDVIELGRQTPRIVCIQQSSLLNVVLQTEPDRVTYLSRWSPLAFDNKEANHHRGAIT